MRKEIQINQADGDGVLCAIHRWCTAHGVWYWSCERCPTALLTTRAIDTNKQSEGNSSLEVHVEGVM